jgi:hypothetical protein
MTYKSTVMPVISYLVPLWKPVISKTWIVKLPVAQNEALRTIMGCHAAASMDHLHQECKLQPVDNHLDLLTTQFLANAVQPHHPSHEIVTAPPAPRPNMKPSLQTCYGASLTPYFNDDGVVAPTNYKKVLSALHMSVTKKSIEIIKPNRVLGTRPPEFSPQEKLLPRLHRTTLNQVRSGFCKNLKSYQKFIRATDDDRCPECNLLVPQSSEHLFYSPANTMVLTPRNRWKRSRDAVEFLSSAPSFDNLAALAPLFPPPLPEPPPADADHARGGANSSG